MGIPSRKSKRLFFILLILAPSIPTIFVKSPTGFAVLIGIPSEIRIGIKIIAAPIPPSEKRKAATNEIPNINKSNCTLHSLE